MDHDFAAAIRLHQHIVVNHWQDPRLIGPDPGIRFNYRIGRFIKSALPDRAWNDDYYYLQAQGYWVLANWLLWNRTGDPNYRDMAIACSDGMLRQQNAEGAWEYPNREWKGRIATAEGTWGALGLLKSYRETSEERFLDGAVRWHRFMVEQIGFQRQGDEVAVNYFAGRGDQRVPNNSAFVLRFLAQLADMTQDQAYLEPCAGMRTFMQRVQRASGEFPYAVPGPGGGEERGHFQCYQYNAFQCLDLMVYYELSGNRTVLPMIASNLSYLRTGQAEDGHALYACGNRHRAVVYHTAVLAAAFRRAGTIGIEGYDEHADRAYAFVLRQQRQDGSFPYSQGDYRVLRDRRSYPRYLAMILVHLLHEPNVHEIRQEPHYAAAH